MFSHHRPVLLVLGLGSGFVGFDTFAQKPAVQAASPGAARASTAASKPAPAPTASPKKAANPRALPINTPGLSRIKALIEYQKKKRAELKTYACPANVRVDAGTGIGPATLAFTSASVSQSVCSSSADLAPAADRGGPCLRCSYQGGVSLQRSGPKSHACWVKPDAASGFACEYVPPLPASQTCRFEIDPGEMDLYPFSDHVRGDTDMYTEGSLFDPGHLGAIHLTVTLTRSGNKLVFKLAGEAEEGGPDYTAFRDYKTVELKSGDVKNGTLADIETCLASYGAQRPFRELTSRYYHAVFDEGWENVDTELPHGPLQFSMRCRGDTAGSDSGQVGCQNIDVERFTIDLK